MAQPAGVAHPPQMDEGALRRGARSRTAVSAGTCRLGRFQQLVIAAFVYPLAIKLMLTGFGSYVHDSDEEAACKTLGARRTAAAPRYRGRRAQCRTGGPVGRCLVVPLLISENCGNELSNGC
jgi:hypothetical protein